MTRLYDQVKEKKKDPKFYKVMTDELMAFDEKGFARNHPLKGRVAIVRDGMKTEKDPQEFIRCKIRGFGAGFGLGIGDITQMPWVPCYAVSKNFNRSKGKMVERKSKIGNMEYIAIRGNFEAARIDGRHLFLENGKEGSAIACVKGLGSNVQCFSTTLDKLRSGKPKKFWGEITSGYVVGLLKKKRKEGMENILKKI